MDLTTMVVSNNGLKNENFSGDLNITSGVDLFIPDS